MKSDAEKLLPANQRLRAKAREPQMEIEQRVGCAPNYSGVYQTGMEFATTVCEPRYNEHTGKMEAALPMHNRRRSPIGFNEEEGVY